MAAARMGCRRRKRNEFSPQINQISQMFLSQDDLLSVVERAPLVSFDLIVRNRRGQVLLGLRKNERAKGFWFVPGGRILKNERLDDAFVRITQAELGQACLRKDARFLGIHEHFYSANFAGKEGVTTHYIVLAYELDWPNPPEMLPNSQHAEHEWAEPDSIRHRPDVHDNVKTYFI